jgi:hypothetical protein
MSIHNYIHLIQHEVLSTFYIATLSYQASSQNISHKIVYIDTEVSGESEVEILGSFERPVLLHQKTRRRNFIRRRRDLKFQNAAHSRPMLPWLRDSYIEPVDLGNF